MSSRVDVLGNGDLPAGVAWLLKELEANGWIVRGRLGETAVRVWPDNHRPKQVAINIAYPLNEHRLEEYRTHTGLPLLLTQDADIGTSPVERRE